MNTLFKDATKETQHMPEEVSNILENYINESDVYQKGFLDYLEDSEAIVTKNASYNRGRLDAMKCKTWVGLEFREHKPHLTLVVNNDKG